MNTKIPETLSSLQSRIRGLAKMARDMTSRSTDHSTLLVMEDNALKLVDYIEQLYEQENRKAHKKIHPGHSRASKRPEAGVEPAPPTAAAQG